MATLKGKLLSAMQKVTAAHRTRSEAETALTEAQVALSEREVRIQELLKLNARHEVQQRRQHERLATMATTMAALRLQQQCMEDAGGSTGGRGDQQRGSLLVAKESRPVSAKQPPASTTLLPRHLSLGYRSSKIGGGGGGLVGGESGSRRRREQRRVKLASRSDTSEVLV